MSITGEHVLVGVVKWNRVNLEKEIYEHRRDKNFIVQPDRKQ